jgi:hypothetical protein
VQIWILNTGGKAETRRRKKNGKILLHGNDGESAELKRVKRKRRIEKSEKDGRWATDGVAFGLIFGIICTDLDAEEGCADRKGKHRLRKYYFYGKRRRKTT